MIDHDRDLSFVKEGLQHGPVLNLLFVILSISKTMHLNVTREVTREDLCHQETIVESSANILDRVWQV